MNWIAESIDGAEKFSIVQEKSRTVRKKRESNESASATNRRMVCGGLVDLQVNGYEGIDVANASLTIDDIENLCRKLAAQGVTQFLPTLTTNSLANLEESLANLVSIRSESTIFQKMMMGIHLEGPFISLDRRSAGGLTPNNIADHQILMNS